MRPLLIALTGLVVACSATHARVGSPPPVGVPTWDYDVELDAAKATLTVRATFVKDAIDEGTALSVADGAEPFVRKITSSAGKLVEQPDDWLAPGCSAGCTIRYSFALGEAAASRRDEIANRYRDVLQSPPGAWLLRPLAARDSDTFRMRVRVPDGYEFATGMRSEGPARGIGRGPYTMFGKLRQRDVRVGDARIVVAIPASGLSPSDDMFATWVERNARAVANTFGRFPMDGSMIGVVPRSGARVGFGRAMAGGLGGSILVDVGAQTDESALASTWVLAHEMVHLGFPSLDRKHRWMEEGLATYLETLVRARVGQATDRDVWFEFMSMMRHGLPAPGDLGLDRTPTWGRLYWGGALFCFVSDVEIRKRTNGTKSLDDALRAILNAGGNNGVVWPIERAFAVGDQGTGVPVLLPTYEKWKEAPVDVDLDALFRALGVRLEGEEVRFDDRAPLAKIRGQMTAQRAAPLE